MVLKHMSEILPIYYLGGIIHERKSHQNTTLEQDDIFVISTIIKNPVCALAWSKEVRRASLPV